MRKRISPIQTKSGSAVSVHEEIEPQIVTAIASPTGRLVKSSMPIHATPRSARPIHTPLASSTKRKTMRRAVMRRSIARYSMSFSSALASADVRGCRRRTCSTKSSIIATASTIAPAAMAICGIHSGVASLPCEMSLKA